MTQFETTPESVFTTPYAAEERISAFLRSVYGWMCGGLAITALVAFMMASSPLLLLRILSIPFAMPALFIVQIGLVIVLSARAERMAAGTAAMLFIAYSALTGITMATVLLVYTGASVASTFVIAAGMFGALALYGTTTSRSLAGWGQFLFMGLIGVVLASFVGVFFHHAGFQFVLGFIGVIVFTGLTAYDAQRLKEMALAPAAGPGSATAIAGALVLYLDFINLFLMLLRLFGGKRD